MCSFSYKPVKTEERLALSIKRLVMNEIKGQRFWLFWNIRGNINGLKPSIYNNSVEDDTNLDIAQC